MTSFAKVQACRVLVVVALLLSLFLAGCETGSRVSEETDERAFRRGKSLQREGRQEEALQAYLSLIAARPDAIESHLEAGVIYLNHIKDPLAAIYHFRSYLALAPQGDHANLVEELILTAQKDFAASLPGNPFGTAVERVNLLEQVKQLQQENTRLKGEALDLEARLEQRERQLLSYREALNRQAEAGSTELGVAPIIIEQPDPEEPARTTVPDRYTVQTGDTLSRISQKVYGQPGRWMEIFQANRDLLPSPNALQPGQVLTIP
jgi:hypothetical protein